MADYRYFKLLTMLLMLWIASGETNGIAQNIYKNFEESWEYLQDNQVRLDDYFGEPLGRTYRTWINNTVKECHFSNFYECIQKKGQESYYCKRKDVLPIVNIEILGYALLFLILLVWNVAGISGGYFTIIVLFGVFRFEWLKVMSICAYLNLLIGLIRFLYYYRTKHPLKNHLTWIDYDLVIWFLPLTILGMFVGYIVYKVAPMFIIAMVSAFYWGGAALLIFNKTISRYNFTKVWN